MIRATAPIILLLALVAPSTTRGAVTWTEDFPIDPAVGGWQCFGDTNLFQWDNTNRQLLVTWDSAKPNSYFHRPLGNILTKSDDFALAFDLRLDSVADKPSTFQLAVALFNFAQATRANLMVGSGASATAGLRSSVEFNYFPGGDLEPTVSCIAVSSNNGSFSQFKFSHEFPLTLDTGVWHRISLAYTAGNQTLTLTKTRAGAPFGTTQTVTLGATFTDFRLDTLALASYNEAGQFPPPGSILARGAVDNFVVTLPEPPVTQQTVAFSNGMARVGFLSRSNWLYTLERSTNCVTWSALPVTSTGTGGTIELSDASPPESRAFYHVKAERP